MKLVGITKRFSKSYKEITMMESFFRKNRWLKAWNLINPFQPSVAINTETSHLICGANQMNDFYMKCSTGPKWVKQKSSRLLFSCEFCKNFGRAIPEKSVKATFSVKFENKQWTQDASWKSIWGKVLKSRPSKFV